MGNTKEFLDILYEPDKDYWDKPDFDRWNYLAAVLIWSVTSRSKYYVKTGLGDKIRVDTYSWKLRTYDHNNVLIVSKWLDISIDKAKQFLGNNILVKEIDDCNIMTYTKYASISYDLANAIREKAMLDPISVASFMSDIRHNSNLIRATIGDEDLRVFIDLQ